MSGMPLPSLLISPARLRPLLGDVSGRFDLDALAACSSSNLILLERAKLGAPSGSVLVTDEQSAGRGSRGRTWLSSPAASLTFSLLWRFDLPMDRLSGLSLVVGLALVEALAKCGLTGVQLKWPNDLLLGEASTYRKLGGILIELQPSQSRADRAPKNCAAAVIGIGLNLHKPPCIVGFAAENLAALPAGALDELSVVPERHVLLAELLISLAQCFDQFAVGGFAALRKRWQAHHAWQDQPVYLLREARIEMEGVCLGADDDGALLVETANGVQRVLSGDLSLRQPALC